MRRGGEVERMRVWGKEERRKWVREESLMKGGE